MCGNLEASCNRFLFLAFTFAAFACTGGVSHAEDLVKSTEGMVQYKLSKVRIENSVLGEVMAIDYKRTREGTGNVSLSIRSDNGPVRVMGLGPRIESSGTIRLRDMLARIRSTLADGQPDGLEFCITATVSTLPGNPKFLVSNIVRHGKLGSKWKPRDLNDREKEFLEQERLRTNPPESVPDGYERSTSDTKLVPGMPVMYGSMGEWLPAVVARPSSRTFVHLYVDGRETLLVVKRQDWLAVSKKVAKQASRDPDAFSFAESVLPGTIFLLKDEQVPATEVDELVPGTPLLWARGIKWQSVHWMAEEGDRFRVLDRSSNAPKMETDKATQFAVTKETLKKLKAGDTDSFAANIKGFESLRIASAATSGTSSATGGMNLGVAPARSETPVPSSEEPAAEVRTWSDASGKFQIVAALVARDDSQVTLQRGDGRTVKVPIDRLSDDDREWLEREPEPEEPDDNPFAIEPISSTTAVDDYKGQFNRVAALQDISWGAQSLGFSPDANQVVVGSRSGTFWFSEITTAGLQTVSLKDAEIGEFNSIAFTPDGQTLLLGGARGEVMVYAVDSSGRLTFESRYKLHDRKVSQIVVSPDGKKALSAGDDKQALCWDVATGRRIALLDQFSGRVKACQFAQGGSIILATDGKDVIGFDLANDRSLNPVAVARSHAAGQSAAFSPDGTQLAVGDTYAIKVFDLTTGRQTKLLQSTEIQWSMRFAPNGRHLFSGGNGKVNLWDTQTGGLVHSETVGSSFYVQSLAISSDGRRLFCPTDHNTATVFEVK
ncbi:SHD1 domain-containing protein [Rhodopirellula halodulae]|uniref:SHD1 domain-containing protein n=1 Tax=Rhodopirellula halodulae TaxID=2894198 RepID=UPI001E5C5574|nr:SHD1 domain-containing protein [Rhodopirellula sp. JC737]MCC9655477.1 hypothetical protein [Rhodopirellula sp. JC737]